jgi:uncharacterized protein
MARPHRPPRRDPVAFLSGVAEKLGWYVYALRDPRTGSLFYVGKGVGNRAYQHARQAKKLNGQSAEALRLETIREILAANLDVGVEIIRHRIPDEQTAYEVEAAVIDALALTGIQLANLVGGHGTVRGWQPLEDIIAEYVAVPIEIAPDHRVALIRIRRRYGEVRSPDDLYEITRQWWKLAPGRRNPTHAFSVHNGIVRAVYRIDSWERELPGGRDRWRFTGEIDPELDSALPLARRLSPPHHHYPAPPSTRAVTRPASRGPSQCLRRTSILRRDRAALTGVRRSSSVLGDGGLILE